MQKVSFRELKVWKNGVEIANQVGLLLEKLPKYALYGFGSHLDKTCVSIPSNIAEGNIRQHTKEYKQFLFYSLGSCAELETQLIIAKNRRYIDQNDFDHITGMLVEEMKMLYGLIRVLK